MRSDHEGGIVWLTGLPSAGKSTLAHGAAQSLRADGYRVYVLDGDRLRAGLNADLGYSERDRVESVRRAGEVACLFADEGMVCIVALISPYHRGRESVRARTPHRFHEVYVATPVAICEQRDPKGLYRRARRGEVLEFTGVSAPYEPPNRPELVIDTSSQRPEVSVAILVDYMRASFPRPIAVGYRCDSSSARR